MYVLSRKSSTRDTAYSCKPSSATDISAAHKAASVSTIIKFGTDGWRARIAADYTFDNLRRCAQGFASYLTGTGNKGADVVIGHDRRFAAEDFAAAAAEVMGADTYSKAMATLVDYKVLKPFSSLLQ